MNTVCNTNYFFNNSSDAILFGEQATRQDCANLKKAILIFQAQYTRLKRYETTFKKRMQIATWAQLCREALETANNKGGEI